MKAEYCNGGHNTEQETWNIVWCLNAWHVIYDKLAKLLPSWASLRMMDSALPLEQQVQDAHVLVPTTGVVSAASIAAAKDLQLIVQPASGYNNIDLAAAKARSIAVCTSPGVNAACVAESALMVMLMLTRRYKEQQETFQQRGLGHPAGHTLANKTLGIVGMGAIGKRFAQMATGLGMEVIGLTSASTEHDLNHMLSQAHVVSLHCPLTAKTRSLIGAAQIAQMRPGAFLLNFARGEVVQRQALEDGLASGHLGGAGLDVHWQEPADPQDAIYQRPNVIALPHAGVCAVEVYDAYAQLLCDNIVRKHENKPLLNQLHL